MREIRNDTLVREATLREMVAIKAMEGMLAGHVFDGVHEEYIPDIIASCACDIANKMIATLNKSAGVK